MQGNSSYFYIKCCYTCEQSASFHEYLKMGKNINPGVEDRCFSIGGRMAHVRERCLGMTDEERRWRAQFLKDQVLSPDEPREVPEYYRNTTNIFRRLYTTPLWKFQKFLEPIVGLEYAYGIRQYIGKTFIMVAAGYIITYYLKYNSNDFAKNGNAVMYKTKGRVFPDDPGYPNCDLVPQELYNNGFYSSVLAVKKEKSPSPHK